MSNGRIGGGVQCERSRDMLKQKGDGQEEELINWNDRRLNLHDCGVGKYEESRQYGNEWGKDGLT